MHKKSELPVKAGFLDEETFSDDSFAQPEPEYAFDQRVTWRAASWRLLAKLLPALRKPPPLVGKWASNPSRQAVLDPPVPLTNP
jgi:hypothetical protein